MSGKHYKREKSRYCSFFQDVLVATCASLLVEAIRYVICWLFD